MADANREMRKFKTEFDDHDFHGRPKKSERLINKNDSSLLGIGLQVVLSGGETNRHYHTGQDAAWLVLEGVARFYGHTDDDVFELHPTEGLFIPDGHEYWFESGSDAPLKVLRISASIPGVQSQRLNFEELKDWQKGRLSEAVAPEAR
jgi:mannose-6-phosphate isomerase-like protein (cupin superfamily)